MILKKTGCYVELKKNCRGKSYLYMLTCFIISIIKSTLSPISFNPPAINLSVLLIKIAFRKYTWTVSLQSSRNLEQAEYFSL